MLEASPARLGAHMHTLHKWDTYYFMPLDLSIVVDGKMDWETLSDFGTAIVIDRLRFIRLADSLELLGSGMYDVMLVSEATSMRFT